LLFLRSPRSSVSRLLHRSRMPRLLAAPMTDIHAASGTKCRTAGNHRSGIEAGPSQLRSACKLECAHQRRRDRAALAPGNSGSRSRTGSHSLGSNPNAPTVSPCARRRRSMRPNGALLRLSRFPLAGPPSIHEAKQKALKILQVFLNDAYEAAKKYQFSN
jgi:hypothetical protein